MKKSISFLLLLLGFFGGANFSSLSAQENFIKGYIILNNSDTLFGKIDYRNWGVNPDVVGFLSETEAIPHNYTPMDILEFGVNGEIYVSGVVLKEVSSGQSGWIDFDPQIKTEPDTIFLQALIKGRKSLYYYYSEARKDNFYIKQGSIFELLEYKEYLKQMSGGNIALKNNRYLGQLTIYLDDCTEIKSLLPETPYRKNGLLKLFRDYYKCFPEESYFHQESERPKAEKGLVAGPSLTILHFAGENYPHLSDAGFKPSLKISAGFYLNLILMRNQQKWSLYNEALFASYKVTDTYEAYENEEKYSVITTRISYSYFKINNLIRFTYPIGNAFVFVNAGLSNGLVLGEQNYNKTELILYNINRTRIEPAMNNVRRYEQGLLMGAGWKHNRLSLEFRYERGNGMSAYVDLKSSVDRFFLLLGYRF